MSAEDNYIPGVCNIGSEQLRKRKRFLAICSCGTIICVAAIEALNAPKTLRLLMFLPIALNAVAAQQVIYKFCYRFGLTGYYGFGKVGYDTKIPENHFREIDRKKSRKMLVSSIVIGLVLTAFYYFV